MHGRDQDAGFMLEVAGRVDVPAAALLLPESEAGTWYPGRFFDPVAANEPQVTQAVAAVEEAVATAGDVPVVLVGFSQGACVVAETLRRAPRPGVRAAAVLTGALMGDDPAPTPAHVAGLPMHFSSSRHDDWIPLEHALAAARSFEAAGADVTTEVSDEREHHVSDAEAAAVRELVLRASR
jgi:phospholipase/carboxylesterase